jgi:uncharacterized protein (DUF433 family)
MEDGVWRIKGKRVSLDSVIYQFRQGRSPEGIQDSFPVLSLAEVYGGIAFYLDHRADLDAYLLQSEAEEEEFSREVAQRYPEAAALKERIREKLSKASR